MRNLIPKIKVKKRPVGKEEGFPSLTGQKARDKGEECHGQ